ncbi:MAG: DUF3883 domain-containing protein [Gemmataceae bacterium]|nr:DUF3883 domain-containing protein [Gemmataceae bacterium]
MADAPTRLETEELVVGYAMSRLDAAYRTARGCRTWTEAFAEAASCLDLPPATFKNLRDEFDPFHDNSRRGWHGRTVRPDRQRVMDDLREVGDAALMALVDRILARDTDATAEAIASLSPAPRTAQAVAERLLTGRRAEEFFLAHSTELVGHLREALLDRRLDACGYDFGVADGPLAIEVKGMKGSAGSVLFTDREWREAAARRGDYLLVVVGDLDEEPRARVIRDPFGTLEAESSVRVSVATVWTASVSVF